MSCENIQIIVVEMSPEMQQDAVECACEAQKNYSAAKDIAKHIKQKFDHKYGPSWHCVVGRHFSSYVSHENYGFIYFYVGPIAILLFKSG